MPFLTLPTVQLHYELHGQKGNPALLLLHGATQTFQTGWQKQITPFSQHYHLIGVDLRGHGQSNNPLNCLDLRQMADDTANLLDHLGYATVHLCGHSGGASTALFMAVRHSTRLRSLILVSNNYQADQARRQADFWNVERIALQEPHWWRQLSQVHTQVKATDLLRWWQEEDLIRPNFMPQELAQIKIPALVVAGDRDGIVPLEQSVELFFHLSNAQLCVVAGTPHNIPHRRPELFNAVVLQFLQQMESNPNLC